MFVGFDNDSFRALLGVLKASLLLGPQGGPIAVPFKCSVMVVGSLSCWRHEKKSFCRSCEAESSVFFQLGLDAPLGAGFAIFVAAICPTWREKLWAFRVPFLGAYFVPFLGPAILTHAAEVPFLGPQSGPQFRTKSRALNALLGWLFDFFCILCDSNEAVP